MFKLNFQLDQPCVFLDTEREASPIRFPLCGIYLGLWIWRFLSFLT